MTLGSGLQALDGMEKIQFPPARSSQETKGRLLGKHCAVLLKKQHIRGTITV